MPIPTYLGWNSALSGLDTAQQALSVISNNISNAQTNGYHREKANIAENAPWPPYMGPNTPVVAGQIGQGSNVESVNRVTNPYYEQVVRNNTSSNSGYSTLQTNLQQVEGILNEPSNVSIHTAMDNFYGAWQTLSSSPDSTAARQAVIAQSQSLAGTFQAVQSHLVQMMDNLNSQISGPAASQVEEVNRYATSLNQLNQQIAAVHDMGQQPNTLLDQRDVVLGKLAALGNLAVTTHSNGTVDVAFGKVSLVTYGATSGGQTTTFTAADAKNLTSGSIWANEQSIAKVHTYVEQLGTLQQVIADGVNSQLQQGFQYDSSSAGVPLFKVSANTSNPGGVATSVTSLSVVSTITPQQLAAAQSPNSPGDGSNSTAIAQQQNATGLLNLAGTPLGATPADAYAAIVSDLGSYTASVGNDVNTSSALLQQSQQLQQSVSGVNLNEEVANMLQFQNMYQAASKFMAVQNQMLQTLLQEV